MREYGDSLPAEEVEYAIVGCPEPYPKLVDAVPEIIGKRPSKLMSLRLKEAYAHQALCVNPLLMPLYGIEPIEERNASIGLLIEYYLNLRHLPPS